MSPATCPGEPVRERSSSDHASPPAIRRSSEKPTPSRLTVTWAPRSSRPSRPAARPGLSSRTSPIASITSPARSPTRWYTEPGTTSPRR
ncbi:hypothetical protein OV079_14445 [Nannocystis pusilla]|uniref:Uncharacterized protein n=1 Tax=Nannocystis pusilla TaxID=889268 RepID=A0A9X3ENY4_9BACT|nr:hypothetical protein [Nannocystis pusilla]MCY1006729.1 hypothetical protein [Nannocystis pusilla]